MGETRKFVMTILIKQKLPKINRVCIKIHLNINHTTQDISLKMTICCCTIKQVLELITRLVTLPGLIIFLFTYCLILKLIFLSATNAWTHNTLTVCHFNIFRNFKRYNLNLKTHRGGSW